MKVVLLGATKGMGRAQARQFAERGDSLFVLGRDLEDARRSAADLEARRQGGSSVGVAECDLRRPETFEPALEAADPMLAHLTPCFFDGAPDAELLKEWRRWMLQYATRLASEGRADSERRAEMKATSPKFIPREWMLAEAYTKAEKGDFSTLHELNALFAAPFDEATPELSQKYYRKPPSTMEKKAGISYFS